jgi:hypothetical protein
MRTKPTYKTSKIILIQNPPEKVKKQPNTNKIKILLIKQMSMDNSMQIILRVSINCYPQTTNIKYPLINKNIILEFIQM